jgi:tetratricopeptide (TPR) repeat protein
MAAGHHSSLFLIAPLLAAVAATSACRERPDVRFARQFQEGKQALRDGQTARALTLADEGVRDSPSDAGSAWRWTFRILQAEASVAALDLSKARPALDATIPGGPDFDNLRGRQEYLRGRATLLAGNLPAALAGLERAVTLAPSDTELRLDVEVLAGQIRMRLGRWDEAESKLGAVVAETTRTGDTYHQALALNNIGMGYVVRSRFDEALPRFEQIFRISGLDDTTVYAAALNNAGICYARLGQFDRAVTLQRRAVALNEKAGRRSEYEQSVGELGTTYLLQEDFEHGLPYLQQALSISGEAGLSADAALWARNLAAAYVYLGKWDEAEKYNGEARRLNPPELAGKLAFNTLHDGHIAAGRGKDEDAVRLFEAALAAPQSEPAIRWSAYDGLAKAAVRAHQPARAAQQFEAALGVIEKTRADLLKTDYKLSFLSGLMQFYRDYVDALVDQQRIERALEVADSSRGRILAEQHGITAPAAVNAAGFVRIARQSGAVLLFYSLGRTRSHLFVVTSAGVKRVDVPAAEEVLTLVRAHDAAIQQSLSGGIAERDARQRALPSARRSGRSIHTEERPRGDRAGWRPASVEFRDAARHWIGPQVLDRRRRHSGGAVAEPADGHRPWHARQSVVAAHRQPHAARAGFSGAWLRTGRDGRHRRPLSAGEGHDLSGGGCIAGGIPVIRPRPIRDDPFHGPRSGQPRHPTRLRGHPVGVGYCLQVVRARRGCQAASCRARDGVGLPKRRRQGLLG